MYVCLAVTCHLHFWQNDRDFLRATVVTRGWNGYRNKGQHRKSTLEKKILPPFQQGFEPATFQSRVRRSNHWAIPAPKWYLRARKAHTCPASLRSFPNVFFEIVPVSYVLHALEKAHNYAQLVSWVSSMSPLTVPMIIGLTDNVIVSLYQCKYWSDRRWPILALSV